MTRSQSFVDTAVSDSNIITVGAAILNFNLNYRYYFHSKSLYNLILVVFEIFNWQNMYKKLQLNSLEVKRWKIKRKTAFILETI